MSLANANFLVNTRIVTDSANYSAHGTSYGGSDGGSFPKAAAIFLRDDSTCNAPS